MLQFLSNYNLAPHNTFGLAEQAKYFVKVQTEAQLEALLENPIYQENKVLWLGGGSNMLLTQSFDGLVVKLEFLGKEREDISESEAIVWSAGGENWHNFVQWTLDQNLGGLENLSLIPGNVGTAPIQNIGAYGVEIKDHFESLKAYNLQKKEWTYFSPEECQFAYRHSIFKAEAKGRYVVAAVGFRLSRKDHNLRMDYGAIRQELERQGLDPSIQNIAKAVIAIRQSKLPDPKEIGNSGSFFKNPIVSNQDHQRLLKAYPDLVAYPAGHEQMKLAAGWLIERAGWKGYRKGDAGVHAKQALVLVNYGQARGAEIKALAEAIQESVYRTFAVALEAEVNII